MITHETIKNLVNEWNLLESTIEKDYVLGWLLWGIGSEPALADSWVFKGGTCLKKCYIETYRFSEDLDFTVTPDGPLEPDELNDIFERVLSRVHEESGIDFQRRPPKFEKRAGELSTKGRIYYIGPRQAPQVASIKIDLLGSEKIARPTVIRKIVHSYSDNLPAPGEVRCYSLEELYAEKIRALGERTRPRDLYDVIYLFRCKDLQDQPELIRKVLVDKCESKGVPITTLELIQQAPTQSELESEWSNMLTHQLQALPPFETYFDSLPDFFKWLEGEFEPSGLPQISASKDDDLSWTPPPTIQTWGARIPLESIRFAASNRLCINLGYNRRKRVIEPYSLRRTKDGNLILHALRHTSKKHRSYRIDRIESVEVTNTPFIPKYNIEVTSMAHHSAPPTTTRRRNTRPSKSVSPHCGSKKKYIITCNTCGREFIRKTRNTSMRPHNNSYGSKCPGKRGRVSGQTY